MSKRRSFTSWPRLAKLGLSNLPTVAGQFHSSRVRRATAPPGFAALLAAFIGASAAFSAPRRPSPSASPSPDYPQLTYTKILKGSVPAYEKVVVNSNGSGSYDGHALNEPPHPRGFVLSSDVTQELFGLAGDLHDFQGLELESHKRVADLGLKTLTFRDGSRSYSTQFNYSMNRTAGRLVDLFEKISAVELHISALDYAMRYDHLGLPRQLALIQIDLDNNSLADPQLMKGALEAIIRNPRYLVLAQVRAKRILARIQKDERN
jgi:hypothetical protein